MSILSPPFRAAPASGSSSTSNTERAARVLIPRHRGRTARRASILVSALLSIGGLVVLGRLVRVAGMGAVFAACAAAGWGVVLIVAAPAVGLCLHTLAWRLLLPPEIRPPLGNAYLTFIAAQAGNELGLGFLGEPLKVTALPRRHRDAAISAVALDNATSAIALVGFFVALGALVTFPRLARSVDYRRVAWLAVAMGLLVGCLVTVLLRASATARDTARSIAKTSSSLLREHPLRIALAAMLHLLAKLWVVVEMGIATEIFGSASVHGSAVLGLAWATAAAAGSPVPGQIGLVEGALVAVAGMAGIGTSAAVAIGLLRRLRSSVWMVVGGLAAITIARPDEHATRTYEHASLD